ncbi:DsbA family protein [Patescibacteria group bacterium]|nr:DsbA family protein [Patescibacteria group bacterium]
MSNKKNYQKNKASKNDFVLGITTAIAVIAIIGFFVVLSLYLKQDKKESVEALPAVPSKQAVQKQAPVKVEVQVSREDHFRGDANALVTIVEFSDFQCPYCSSFHQTMLKIVKDFPKEVKWVYKHFPLDSIHPFARKAAEASECAADQNKFWEYTDELFVKQREISPALFTEIAGTTGLDINQFNGCLESGKYASKVEADYQQGIKAGVQGTPGSFINGQTLAGVVPYNEMKSRINELLNE